MSISVITPNGKGYAAGKVDIRWIGAETSENPTMHLNIEAISDSGRCVGSLAFIGDAEEVQTLFKDLPIVRDLGSALTDVLHQLSTDLDLETVTGADKYRRIIGRLRELAEKYKL